jgi:hypothetical protein
MSSGGGQQTSSYKPPAEVMAAYKDLVSRGQSLLGNKAPQYTPEMAAQYAGYGAGLVAPMTPDQIQAMRSIANTQGYTDPFINAGANMASQSGSPLDLMRFSEQGVQQYMSPYLNNVMRSAVGNINETNAQQQQQVLGNAISRGAWGGDRAGVAQSELARQQGLANNATISNLLNSGYSQALGQFNIQQAKDLEAQALSRQYGIAGAQALGNLGALGQKSALEQAQAQFGAGLAAQQQQQAGLSTGYQQYLNQFQYPYNQLGWYGGLVSGAGSGMGGTTTTNMPGASPLSSVLGIGSMLGAMGGSSGIAGLFSLSDKRAKENIEPVGETYDGQKIYRYNFKGSPKTEIGLIAQEVERHHPDAVGIINGIRGVDYHDATEAAAKRGKFYSGGVVGHFADGGNTDWVNTKGGKNSGASTTPTTSTWGYVAPNPLGDTVTPALNAYQNMANSGQGSYEDLQNSYLNYLKSFQMPSGTPLPMVGFAPKDTGTGDGTGNGTGNGNNNGKGPGDHHHNQAQNWTKNSQNPLDWMNKNTGSDHFNDPKQSGYTGPGTGDDSPSESGPGPGNTLAHGGIVNHFAGGGLVPQIHMDYGMKTKADVKNEAEQASGSGVINDPTAQALGSEDVLQSKAHGGVVHKALAGEVSGDTATDGQGVVPPAPVDDNFDEVINKTLPRIKMAESGGKNIANEEGTSSAFGPYQFTHGTWKDLISKNPDMKLTEYDRLRPEAQEKMAPVFAKQIAGQLKSSNIPVTPETLRMGWFLGPQGATNFIKKMSENPDAPAYELDPQAAKSNQSVFFNKDGTPKTVNQVFTQMSATLGKEEKPTPTTLLDKILGRTPSSGTKVASNTTPNATERQSSGGFFPGLDDPGRLALFKFGATLAGTPGPFGYGLAAAANAYADSMIGSKRLETESNKRAAETERETASAMETRQRGLAQGTIQTAAGPMYQFMNDDGTVTLKRVDRPTEAGDWIKYNPKDGAFTKMDGTPTTSPFEAAPKNPEQAAPGIFSGLPIAPEAGQNPNEILGKYAKDEIQQASKNDKNWQMASEAYAKTNADAQIVAQQTAGVKNDLTSLVKAATMLGDVSEGDFTGSGAMAGARQDFANKTRSMIRAMGYEIPEDMTDEDITSGQLFQKVARLAVARGARPNEAASSLLETAAAYPNIDQTPKARAYILATFAVANQQAQDRANFVGAYGRASNNLGMNIDRAFNEATGGYYIQERNAIAQMIESTREGPDGKRTNPIDKLITDINNDPKHKKEIMAAFDKQVEARYGISNLSRAFVR